MPSPRLNHSQRDSSEFHENNNIVSSPLHWQTKEEPPPAVADNFTAQQRTNPHNRCCADVIINHLQEVNQVSEATEAQTPTWIKWTSGCLLYSRGATIRLWKGLWTVEYDRNKWFKSVLLFNGKALFAPAVASPLILSLDCSALTRTMVFIICSKIASLSTHRLVVAGQTTTNHPS